MASSSFLKLRFDGQNSQIQDNIGNQLQPIATALARTPIMGAAAPAWVAPSLLNAFVNTGGLNATAGYHRDALGYFHGKGELSHVAGTGANTVIFTLPQGYRPNQTQRFAVRGTAGAAQALIVSADGQVKNEVVVAAGGSLSLAFSFLAEK